MNRKNQVNPDPEENIKNVEVTQVTDLSIPHRMCSYAQQSHSIHELNVTPNTDNINQTNEAEEEKKEKKI
jgi:hypothetical protein